MAISLAARQAVAYHIRNLVAGATATDAPENTGGTYLSMSRKTTAILAIVGLLIFAGASIAPHIPAVQQWQRNDYQSGVAFFVSLAGELVGLALMLAAYTGAIVKVSRLEQNRWLWAMGIGVGLAITGYGAIVTLILLLAYIAFGPTKPAIQSTNQSAGQSVDQSAEKAPSPAGE